jgi:hypothetical protein
MLSNIPSQRGWIVHTKRGPYYVPGDVVEVPEAVREGDLEGDWLSAAAAERIEKYTGIEDIFALEITSGFFVHLSVLGSRENEWTLFATEQEMLDEVLDARLRAGL